MNVFESIADRRIQEARAAGMFDNLALSGKPIPDLDHERPPGWWADELVRRERLKAATEEPDGDPSQEQFGGRFAASPRASADRTSEHHERMA